MSEAARPTPSASLSPTPSPYTRRENVMDGTPHPHTRSKHAEQGPVQARNKIHPSPPTYLCPRGGTFHAGEEAARLHVLFLLQVGGGRKH